MITRTNDSQTPPTGTPKGQEGELVARQDVDLQVYHAPRINETKRRVRLSSTQLSRKVDQVKKRHNEMTKWTWCAIIGRANEAGAGREEITKVRKHAK